jgi:hypothetical protein
VKSCAIYSGYWEWIRFSIAWSSSLGHTSRISWLSFRNWVVWILVRSPTTLTELSLSLLFLSVQIYCDTLWNYPTTHVQSIRLLKPERNALCKRFFPSLPEAELRELPLCMTPPLSNTFHPARLVQWPEYFPDTAVPNSRLVTVGENPSSNLA